MTVVHSSRAESAPPTRGRDGHEKPLPIRAKPPTTPRPDGPPPTTLVREPNSHKTGKRSRKASATRQILRRDPLASRCSLAMSRTESVLVSAAGDVIVCRCRRSSCPYMSSAPQGALDSWSNLFPCCDTDFVTSIEGPWSPVFENLTVEKNVSGEMSQTSEFSTYEWEQIDKKHLKTKTKKKDSAIDVNKQTGQKDATKTTNSTPTHQPPTLAAMNHLNVYDGGILPLPSFDYSHIHDGNNDMVPPKPGTTVAPKTPSSLNRAKNRPSVPTILESPEEKKDEEEEKSRRLVPSQQFFHGVPAFLSSLSQVPIAKVSAHPLGAHVLMISADALLFTYGLNIHGQLGIGIKSHIRDENRGFIATPNLITPLLENGGKTINCAAGVDHSLVVVATEGRRLQKLHTNPDVANSDAGVLALARVASSPARVSTDNNPDGDDETIYGGTCDESVRHHQVYGFGSNDFMKIGLVSATLADDGAAGDIDDILLPHRVAVHCTVWPQTDSASSKSSLPPHGVFDIAASAEHSAALVRRATGDIEVYMWGNATLGSLGLPVQQDPAIKIRGGITRRTTSNANNIFPLPTVVESLSYRPHKQSPASFPTEVSLGPYCSFVVMSNGTCMSFGFSAEGMLGHGYGVTHTMNPTEVFLPSQKGAKGNGIVTVSAGAFHAVAITENGQAYSWGINSDDRLGLGGVGDFAKTVTTNPGDAKEDRVIIEWVPQKIDIASLSGDAASEEDDDSTYIVRACAGYDSSMLVARSGQVLSFGKRSGRLGKGEVAKNVNAPEPMYGGLRLFHNRSSSGSNNSKPKGLHRRIQSERCLQDSAKAS